ncbi:MAG: ATP synthase F0 subunit B [Deltaproteobacteria bacterium RIFOXYD12_FULL_57_12]|nr:MAG: ATP synthase F0 subunit B [Deltaproteobacteria bacterium RIFOXYD12_FULL_57_12]
MDKHVKFLKFRGIALAAIFVLVTAGVACASGGEGGHGGGGIPAAKWWDLLWRTLNFAALLVILIKFLAKPLANALKGRQMAIRDHFSDLEARKAEAERTYRGFEEKLAKIELEVNEIIANAKAYGETEKQRIIDEANRAAADIKRQTEKALEHELALAKLHLREDVANQAVRMAEELIKKNLKEEDQVKLIENYLEKVGTVQ